MRLTITPASSSGTPGGSNTQVQFNDSSAFGGDAGLTYNKTTDSLTIAGDLTVSGNDITFGSGRFAIGSSVTASGNNDLAIGMSALARGDFGVAIGYAASSGTAGGANQTSVAIGYSSTATGDSGVVVGRQSSANYQSAVAIGRAAAAGNEYTVAIGYNISATGSGTCCIGKESGGAGNNATAVGVSSLATANYATCVGNSAWASVNAEYAAVVGTGCQAHNLKSAIVGYNSVSNGNFGVCIGVETLVSHNYSVAFGWGAITTATSQLMIGSDASAEQRLSMVTFGGAIFNEGGNNFDFRIEGDTDANLFFSDASTDRVGIGTASPSDTFSVAAKFDVSTNGVVTKYNNITTVSNGVPSEYATVDLTAQTAAKTATTIYTPTASGMFRISIALQVTTAATSSSALGGTTGVVITYTEPDGSVAQSIVPLLTSEAGAVVVPATGNTGNATTTQSQGSAVIYAKTGIAIQYAIGYTSSGATPMAYSAHLKVEAL